MFRLSLICSSFSLVLLVIYITKPEYNPSTYHAEDYIIYTRIGLLIVHRSTSHTQTYKPHSSVLIGRAIFLKRRWRSACMSILAGIFTCRPRLGLLRFVLRLLLKRVGYFSYKGVLSIQKSIFQTRSTFHAKEYFPYKGVLTLI